VQKATGTDKILVEGAVGDRERAKIAQLVARTPCTQLSLTRVTLATADELAQILGLLPRLADLSVYGGKIADWTPLAKVKTLRKIFLNGVAIAEELPPPFGQLDKLVELSLLHLPKLARIDLSGCKRLARFRVWSCMRLRDLSSLHALPALREVVLVGTPHDPKGLRTLLALPQIKHISAQFGSVRKNRELDELLVEYGKTRHPA
jgi:hypothetical protein